MDDAHNRPIAARSHGVARLRTSKWTGWSIHAPIPTQVYDARVGCVICDHLAADHEHLELMYQVASDVMISRHAEPSAAVFNALRAAAENARLDCEIARLTLEQHRRVHTGAN